MNMNTECFIELINNVFENAKSYDFNKFKSYLENVYSNEYINVKKGDMFVEHSKFDNDCITIVFKNIHRIKKLQKHYFLENDFVAELNNHGYLVKSYLIDGVGAVFQFHKVYMLPAIKYGRVD